MATKTPSWMMKVGGRKVVIFLVTLAAGIALGLTGNLNDSALWLLLGLFGAFCTGNAAEHIGGGLKARGAAEEKP